MIRGSVRAQLIFLFLDPIESPDLTGALTSPSLAPLMQCSHSPVLTTGLHVYLDSNDPLNKLKL